jgi:hypothetical protein
MSHSLGLSTDLRGKGVSGEQPAKADADGHQCIHAFHYGSSV